MSLERAKFCHFGHLVENMAIPKVSIDHQGFAGTITHMDGMIRKEKDKERKGEREVDFMYIQESRINRHEAYSLQ